MTNLFLKDIDEYDSLSNNIIYPEMSDYLTAEQIEKLETSGFYDETKITNRILRKYNYNCIATKTIIQFYDLLNELIEENFSEYLMTLVTISDDYSIQNIDTRDETHSHVVDSENQNLVIDNNTPSNQLNIANIKAGTSASNVTYTTDKSEEYTDTIHIESTSALNTTQSNIEAQIKVNKLVQQALNKFVNSLSGAFSPIISEYYEWYNIY